MLSVPTRMLPAVVLALSTLGVATCALDRQGIYFSKEGGAAGQAAGGTNSSSSAGASGGFTGTGGTAGGGAVGAGGSGGSGGEQGGAGGTGGSGGSGGSGGAPFVPTDVTSLKLWLRADLGVTLNGATVASWADQSATGADASQSLAFKQPTFVASHAAFGGAPALDFDGIDDALSHVTNAVSSSSLDHSFFAVVDSDSANATSRWVWETQGGRLGFYFTHVSGGGRHGVFDDASRDVAGAVPVAGGTYITWQLDGTDGTCEVWERSTSAGVNATCVGKALGGDAAVGAFYAAAAFFFDGRIGEIVLYDRKLTAPELALVHGYLADRYGL